MQQALAHRTNRHPFSNDYLDEWCFESTGWDKVYRDTIETAFGAVESLFGHERRDAERWVYGSDSSRSVADT